jgi:hypothetical protein
MTSGSDCGRLSGKGQLPPCLSCCVCGSAGVCQVVLFVLRRAPVARLAFVVFGQGVLVCGMALCVWSLLVFLCCWFSGGLLLADSCCLC